MYDVLIIMQFQTTVASYSYAVCRLKSIMFFNLQLFFLEILFKFTYGLFSTSQKAPLNELHANILIKYKQLYLATNQYPR